MTPSKIHALAMMRVKVQQKIDTGDYDAAITFFRDNHGARYRFNFGAYEFRLLGVAGTSTCNNMLVLQSWVRAADRRLAKIAGR